MKIVSQKKKKKKETIGQMRNWVRLEERPSMAIVIDPAHKKKTALIPNYAIVPIPQYIRKREESKNLPW